MPIVTPFKFSIILPVKNGGDYLRECINSILAQSIPDFNLLILENYSTDGTTDYLSSLDDKRIGIFPAQSPLTMESNWKRIAAIDKNEFITIIGHDDTLHPEYLATMEALIAKHPDASLYQSHFQYIDAKGDLIRPCKPMEEVQNAAGFLECQMKRTLDSMGTGYMMRSSDYDALGGIPYRYPNLIFADYELWVRLIMKSYKATAREECFSYRLHENISKLTNGEAYKQAFGEYMLFLNDVKEQDIDIASTIDRYGKEMLLYFCQSLSHRLLKTNKIIRKTSISAFINECRHYAELLIPGQSFSPLLKPGILTADLLDNTVGLKLFGLYKKLTS